MKIIFLLILAIGASLSLSDTTQWINFKHTYGKLYANSLEEKLRFSIFQENLRKIEQQNKKFQSGNSSYQYGINQFADLTSDEFLKKVNFAKKAPPIYSTVFNKKQYTGDLPSEIDWRERGAVTKVRNDPGCGYCWSHSVIGVIEGVNFIHTGELVTLSKQNLEECVSSNSSDCTLCWRDKAFEYAEENGVMTEKDYPQRDDLGDCKFNASKPIVKISEYVKIDRGDEYDLKRAIALNGPTAVAVDATYKFQLYATGILDDDMCGNTINDLNLGMLVVGYNSSTSGVQDYWIVKNSWGSFWGMDGYILLSMNKNNQCGIATSGIYALVE